jgi:hypothetical protein
MKSYNLMQLFVSVIAMSLLSTLQIGAQSDYQVVCIGFYNLENLFDPSDDLNLDDGVGLRMSERGIRALLWPNARRSIIGSTKAAVLPVPVWAIPSRSRPVKITGMARS